MTTSSFFKTFRLRFLSTCALVGVLALLFWWGIFGVYLALMAAAGLLTQEWLTLCHIERRKIFFIIVPTMLFAMYLSHLGKLRLGLGVLFSMASLGVFLSWFAWHRRFLWGSLSLIYFGVPLSTLVWMLYTFPYGLFVLLWVICIVSSTDIGAYLVGSWLKGPKLIPEVSPNKTWSGFVGGLLVALMVGCALYRFMTGGVPPLYVVIACSVISLVSTLGDLIESLIKRYHHVKDSGTLIPGHGGLFDRLDSYLLVFPLLVWMVWVAPGMFEAFPKVGHF